MKHVKLSIALATASIAILLAGCGANSSAKSTASNAKVEATTEATDTSIESTKEAAEVSEATIETIAEGNSTEETSNSVETTEVAHNSESSKTYVSEGSSYPNTANFDFAAFLRRKGAIEIKQVVYGNPFEGAVVYARFKNGLIAEFDFFYPQDDRFALNCINCFPAPLDYPIDGDYPYENGWYVHSIRGQLDPDEYFAFKLQGDIVRPDGGDNTARLLIYKNLEEEFDYSFSVYLKPEVLSIDHRPLDVN